MLNIWARENYWRRSGGTSKITETYGSAVLGTPFFVVGYRFPLFRKNVIFNLVLFLILYT